MQILTVETTVGFRRGDVISLPIGKWPWWERLWAWFFKISLPPREKFYVVIGVADDHTVAVEDYP